jgi:SPP1 family predicted phage head-tail adaptor
MRAGRMHERIDLQSKVVTRDALGAEVVTWSTVHTVNAEAQPLSGREYVAMRQAQSDISIRFRLRYLPGISTGMRVVWRLRAYDIIEAINVRARDAELELLCSGDAGDA